MKCSPNKLVFRVYGQGSMKEYSRTEFTFMFMDYVCVYVYATEFAGQHWVTESLISQLSVP